MNELELEVEDTLEKLIGLLVNGLILIAFINRIVEHHDKALSIVIAVEILVVLISLMNLSRIFIKQYFKVRIMDDHLEYGIMTKGGKVHGRFQSIVWSEVTHVRVAEDRRRIYFTLSSGKKKCMAMTQLLDGEKCEAVIDMIRKALDDSRESVGDAHE